MQISSVNPNTGTGGFTSEGGSMSGPLFLHADPTSPLEAATKHYVDNIKNNLNAGNISSLTISPSLLPAFTGDFTSAAGTSVLTLGNTGITPGTYTRLTVDAKGRGNASAPLLSSHIPNLDLSKVNSGMPVTLAGYGITDGVSINGDTLTGFMTLAAAPTNVSHLANKKYVDDSGSGLGGVNTGDTLRRPSITTPTGFLRTNGGSVSKTTYAALYGIIGDAYSLSTQPGNGQPWEQQSALGTGQSGDISGWAATATPFPTTIINGAVFVTANYVYVASGQFGDGTQTSVYSAPINSDGTLGAWTQLGNLPTAILGARAVVTKNRVYLVGGASASPLTYTAAINGDGTLGAWSTGPAFPENINFCSAFVTSNRLYAVGGNDFSSYSNHGTVYYAVIGNDGTLGAWVKDADMVDGISNAQCIVTKTRVYIVGGSVNGVDSSNAYSAVINADGSLGAWAANGNAPAIMIDAMVYVSNSTAYLIGGANTQLGNLYNTVYRATINADGTLGSWTSGTTIPVPTYAAGVAATKNHLYYIGGSNNNGDAAIYSAAIAGGLNDYSPYYNGAIAATSATEFRLPDTTTTDVPNIFTFIKY